MNTEPNHDLTHALTREAEQFGRRGGSELEIGQVLARAGEIRRGRRMRATMLMAACVLAIAVPTVLVAVNRPAHQAPQPAKPTKINLAPITLTGLKTGERPKIDGVQGRVWHASDDKTGRSGGRVIGAVAIGDDTLVATSSEQGQRAHLIPQGSETAQEVQSWPMEGGFAVSAEGTLAAFVMPDGTPMVIQDGAAHPLPKIPAEGGYTATAVFGPDCTLHADFEGCGVWVTTQGQKTGTWESWSSGAARRVDSSLRWVTAVVDGDKVAGVTQVHDDLSTCSQVESFADQTPLWSTCGYQLTAFSPDGAHVLAKPDGDGLGPRSLAVYSADGKEIFDLAVAHDGFIGQTVWEDDSHVLATVHEQGDWAVVRIGLDGSREYAVPAVHGDDANPPFVLPSR